MISLLVGRFVDGIVNILSDWEGDCLGWCSSIQAFGLSMLCIYIYDVEICGLADLFMSSSNA